VVKVRLNRAPGELKLARDVIVGQTAGDKLGHLVFATAQRRRGPPHGQTLSANSKGVKSAVIGRS
jgi:hypothetical protein